MLIRHEIARAIVVADGTLGAERWSLIGNENGPSRKSGTAIKQQIVGIRDQSTLSIDDCKIIGNVSFNDALTSLAITLKTKNYIFDARKYSSVRVDEGGGREALLFISVLNREANCQH